MINKIRTFGYTMKNPIPRKIFFLYHFAPKRYTEFCDFMYGLNVEYQMGKYTKEQCDKALLAFWLSVLSITHNTHNDSHLSVQHPLHWV